MMKKAVSVLFMLTLLVCLLSVTASAAPFQPGWHNAPFHSSLDDRLPPVPGMNDDFAMDEPQPEEDVWAEGLWDEESPAQSDAADLPMGDYILFPDEEAVPVLPEETPESLEAAIALAEQIKPDGPYGEAVVTEPAAEVPAPGDDSDTVSAGEEFYAGKGMTVYNNGGTVYGNLATVYNNGGTVYNNEGTVYNNNGVVYSNGGTVYNNNGLVFRNGGEVYGFDDAGVVESRLQEDMLPADWFVPEGFGPEAEDAMMQDEASDMPFPEDAMMQDYTVAEEPMTDDFPLTEDDMLNDYAVSEEPPFDDFAVAEKPFFDDYAETEAPVLDDYTLTEEPVLDDYAVTEDSFDDTFFFPDEPAADDFSFESAPVMDDPFASDVFPADDGFYPYSNDLYEPDYLEYYAPVLDTYRAFLGGEMPTEGAVTEQGDYYLELGETGISYLCFDADTLGYCLIDLDGDAVPELLVGSVGSDYYDICIYDMFTLVDGVPQRVLASSGRSRYHLTEDDLILHEGSGGASYNFVGLYEFSGADLNLLTGVVMLEDYYYQVFGDSVADYYETGEQEVPISEEEYHVLSEVLEDLILPFEINEF